VAKPANRFAKETFAMPKLIRAKDSFGPPKQTYGVAKPANRFAKEIFARQSELHYCLDLAYTGENEAPYMDLI